MKSRISFCSAALALCLMMTGCRSTELHLYDDKPPAAAAQLSLITIPAGLDIHSVDDRKNDMVHVKRRLFMSADRHGVGQRRLLLKQGEHVIRLSLSRPMWLETKSDQGYSHTLSFETLAGGTYRLVYTVVTLPEKERLGIRVWVEQQNKESGWTPLQGVTDQAPLTVKRGNWSASEAEKIYNDWGTTSWPDRGLVVFSSVMRRKCPPFPIEFTFSKIGEPNKAFIEDGNFQRWKPDLQSLPCVTLYSSIRQVDLLTGNPPRSLKPGDSIPDDQTIGELHVVALQGGRYAAHGFFHDHSAKVRSATTVFNNNEYYAKPYCVPFEVKPGMITYLGSFVALAGKTRLELMPGRGDTIVTDTAIIVEDQRKRDLTLFKKQYPDTGVASAMINLLQ